MSQVPNAVNTGITHNIYIYIHTHTLKSTNKSFKAYVCIFVKMKSLHGQSDIFLIPLWSRSSFRNCISLVVAPRIHGS